MASLIHFRVTPGKWLKSACNVVICGLFAICMIGSAATGIIIRGGGFTFCFKCCLSEKPIVDVSTRSLKFWNLPNYIRFIVFVVEFDPISSCPST